MTKPITHRRIALLPAVAVVALVAALASCTKSDETHDHEHDHDHDHDHAVAETHGEAHDHGDGDHVDEVTLTSEAIERYGVKVESARSQALRPTFVAPARVSFNADAMAHVGSPLRGRATEIMVKLGDAVRRGDALLVVESPELGEAQADFLQKRTAARSAAPSVDLAKVAWERAKGLFEQSQGISLTEVQKREAEYKAAVAALQAAESAAVAAENRLHLLGMSQAAVESLATTGEIAPKCIVPAPIDGQVVQREVTLGELVGPDREALLVLADTSTLWVLADVPEARLREVAKGAPAWVTVGTVATVSSSPRRFEGQVGFVAPLVDATTRTGQVRIEVPSASLTLRPGMFAQVEIAATDPDAPSTAPVLAVPDEAVQTVEGGPAVFVPVKDEPNTFAKRAVSVGKSIGGFVPVLSGLAEGEEFVARGTFILKAELGKGTAAHEH
ncbi:MAG: efflux RND transporter periplasmic adaptor subunit [Phycisphaerales bacterium]